LSGFLLLPPLTWFRLFFSQSRLNTLDISNNAAVRLPFIGNWPPAICSLNTELRLATPMALPSLISLFHETRFFSFCSRVPPPALPYCERFLFDANYHIVRMSDLYLQPPTGMLRVPFLSIFVIHVFSSSLCPPLAGQAPGLVG